MKKSKKCQHWTINLLDRSCQDCGFAIEVAAITTKQKEDERYAHNEEIISKLKSGEYADRGQI